MTLRLAFPLLLLAGCATQPLTVITPLAAPATLATQAEDLRLNAFLDAAFDATTALSPENQTAH